MDYSKLIRQILKTGLTQYDVARRISRSQSVVSDIVNARTTDLRKSTADAIEALHAEVVGSKRKSKTAPRQPQQVSA